MSEFDEDNDLAPFLYLGKGKLSETNGQWNENETIFGLENNTKKFSTKKYFYIIISMHVHHQEAKRRENMASLSSLDLGK